MNPTPPPTELPTVRKDLRWTVHQHAGKLWYSVLDPENSRWFRLGEREYAVASRLQKGKTPAELLEKMHEQDSFLATGDLNAVTEQDILQVSKWLVQSQLVENQSPKTEPTPKPALTLNPFYMRIPLIPGYRLESALKPLVPFISRWMLISMLVSSCIAVILAVANWSLLAQTTSHLFVADGPLYWMLAWLILKSAHELAHAAVAIKVKSDIRSAGVSFIFLAPVPFVDVTDLWSIPNRWNRIACSGAGIAVEMALASVAVLIAVTTTDDSLRYFCCALASMGTVSTLAFNANPLMRFDGYFILSDLLNQPNLWTQATQASKKLLKKIFQPIRLFNEGWPHLGLAFYGLACTCYRISMLLTVAATAILFWDGIGVMLVVWGVYAMFLQPWLKQRQMQSQASPAPPNGSSVQWLNSVGLGGVLSALLLLIPSPIQPSAPGVVNYHQPTLLHSEAQGILQDVPAKVGSRVHEGEILAVLSNPELELELEWIQIDVLHAQESIRFHKARGTLALVQSESARLESLMTQLRQLETRVQRLVIRAPHAGILVAIPIENDIGKKVEVGESICMIAPSLDLEVSVSASQKDAKMLRGAIGQATAVRISGGPQIQGVIEAVDPKGSDYLSEPLLSANYSGPIQVEFNSDDRESSEFRLVSPRFQVRVRLKDSANVVPGQMAWIPIPGERMSLFTAVSHWLEDRWRSLKQTTFQSG